MFRPLPQHAARFGAQRARIYQPAVSARAALVRIAHVWSVYLLSTCAVFVPRGCCQIGHADSGGVDDVRAREKPHFQSLSAEKTNKQNLNTLGTTRRNQTAFCKSEGSVHPNQVLPGFGSPAATDRKTQKHEKKQTKFSLSGFRILLRRTCSQQDSTFNLKKML